MKLYDAPPKQRLCIKASFPNHYSVEVKGSNYPFDADKRVDFDVPIIPRGCSGYFLGMKYRDGSPYNVRLIGIVERGRMMYHLSLRDIARLPLDEQGYHVLAMRR